MGCFDELKVGDTIRYQTPGMSAESTGEVAEVQEDFITLADGTPLSDNAFREKLSESNREVIRNRLRKAYDQGAKIVKTGGYKWRLKKVNINNTIVHDGVNFAKGELPKGAHVYATGDCNELFFWDPVTAEFGIRKSPAVKRREAEEPKKNEKQKEQPKKTPQKSDEPPESSGETSAEHRKKDPDPQELAIDAETEKQVQDALARTVVSASVFREHVTHLIARVQDGNKAFEELATIVNNEDVKVE